MPTPLFVATIELAFDPVLRLGDVSVRLETVGLAITVLGALLLAARNAGRTPARDPGTLAPAAGIDQAAVTGEAAGHLRRDDLLFVVLGIVPGAVVGGRLGYALIHLDYFAANPGAIVDPGVGSLQLSAAVVGGLATGLLIASLLESPLGRWVHVATVPVFLALAIGKLVLVLGGDGQGAPSDLPWATSYSGPGRWGSLGPAIPSHPAQVYEALVLLGVVAAVLALHSRRTFAVPDGRLFFVALGAWAVGRIVVAFVWREPGVLGPVRADQLLTVVVLAVAVVGYRSVRGSRSIVAESELPAAVPSGWTSPGSRPRP